MLSSGVLLCCGRGIHSAGGTPAARDRLLEFDAFLRLHPDPILLLIHGHHSSPSSLSHSMASLPRNVYSRPFPIGFGASINLSNKLKLLEHAK